MTKEQLGALILTSERQMYVTAKSILQNDADCEDAMQEAIVKAFSCIGQLKQDPYAKTWLIRILMNECHTLLRKKQRTTSYETYEIEAKQKGEYMEPTAKEPDYSSLYETLQHLPEKLRLPVTLYYVEDFSIREIAAILDISEGAVQKRLARAREQLRKELSTWKEEYV